MKLLLWQEFIPPATICNFVPNFWKVLELRRYGLIYVKWKL